MPDVHPLIRLVMLLVFSAGMALAQPLLLTGGLVLLLLLYLQIDAPAPKILWSMIRRLRWLFVAIMLIYGWWTPGTSMWPAAGPWSPTVDGIYLGMTRVLVLLVIVTAVHFLIQTTSREKMLPAIMQLIRPLTTDATRERVAVRMLLTIETVPRVQGLAADLLSNPSGSENRLSRLTKLSRRLYMQVLDDAAQAQTGHIEVIKLAPPPVWQWLIPTVMGAAILLAVMA